jgi:hypothetical protein
MQNRNFLFKCARWSIMLCEGSVGAIDLGFIAVGSGHSRFEIIRDDDLGDPTERRKGPDM